MRKTVFVSSTYRDLKKHRDAIRQVLTDFNVRINGMEDFGTRKNPPLNTCIEEIDQSQIYIGIISMVYGTVDNISGKSYTQLEYERADEKDLDINIFLIDEKDGQIKTGNIEFGENHEKLIHFKDILKREHTIKAFINENDLAQNVYELMKRLTKEENGLTENTFFSVFDNFLNAILQSTEDKKTIIESIKKIKVPRKDLNDWKEKIISVL